MQPSPHRKKGALFTLCRVKGHLAPSPSEVVLCCQLWLAFRFINQPRCTPEICGSVLCKKRAGLTLLQLFLCDPFGAVLFRWVLQQQHKQNCFQVVVVVVGLWLKSHWLHRGPWAHVGMRWRAANHLQCLLSVLVHPAQGVDVCLSTPCSRAFHRALGL